MVVIEIWLIKVVTPSQKRKVPAAPPSVALKIEPYVHHVSHVHVSNVLGARLKGGPLAGGQCSLSTHSSLARQGVDWGLARSH